MIRHRAPDTLSEYWDEVAAEQAVQATQPLTGSDSGLAPGSQSGPATRCRGTDRSSLRPVTGKLKRKCISSRLERQGFRNPITCTCNFAAVTVEFDVLNGETT
ncbi:TPA: hypothetical protein ACH3X1_005378 [Trebouxia sp. C0004]